MVVLISSQHETLTEAEPQPFRRLPKTAASDTNLAFEAFSRLVKNIACRRLVAKVLPDDDGVRQCKEKQPGKLEELSIPDCGFSQRSGDGLEVTRDVFATGP